MINELQFMRKFTINNIREVIYNYVYILCKKTMRFYAVKL